MHIAVILLHAFIGWALCDAVIVAGRKLAPMEIVLKVHAAAAPLIFAAVSFVYFTRFSYTSPLVTAAVFTAFIMAMDVFVVALFMEKSFAMFRSFLGTWLPFLLIFAATFLTGFLVNGISK